MNFSPNSPSNSITSKILVAIIAVVLTAVVTFAFSRANAITQPEATGLVMAAEARVNSRIDAVEANHKDMNDKLDKLSEDVARVNAQVEILLKRSK